MTPSGETCRRHLSECKRALLDFIFVKRPISKPPLLQRRHPCLHRQAIRLIGTREIARAFRMKNADRVELKRMPRAGDAGQVDAAAKLHEPGKLPHVVLCDITTRDRDGG